MPRTHIGKFNVRGTAARAARSNKHGNLDLPIYRNFDIRRWDHDVCNWLTLWQL